MNGGQISFPASVVQLTQQQLAQFARIGATRIVSVPALAAPVPVSTGAGTTVQAPLLTWRDDGTVIAMYGQELTGTLAKFAQTALRLQFMGDEDLITNGASGDYAPFLSLFGPNLNWYAITRRVKRGDNWTITYRNQDAAAVANPAVNFAFIADADLGRQQRSFQAAQQQNG